MTTIAYKDGVLAADTLITCGDHRDGYTEKVKRIGGVLLAAAGSAIQADRFFEWAQRGFHPADRPSDIPEDEKCNWLRVESDGSLSVWANGSSWKTKPMDGMYALGSGSEYALGAMAAGASPEEAVRIAMKFDTKTGGDITVVTA